MGLTYDDIYDDKHDKYQQQYYDGKIKQWDVEELARASADRAHKAGDYVRRAPMQAPANHGRSGGGSPHSSIDSDSPQQNAGGILGTNDDGDYVYGDDPVLEGMFANVGGLKDGHRGVEDDGQSDVAPAPAGPTSQKLGWGSRLWNGAKAFGGIFKNLLGYNAIRHGIGGAFRKRKIRKNQAKLDAAREGLEDLKAGGFGGITLGRSLQQQFDEAEKKIHFNRLKLGENRKYRTGREWKNEWSRLFTGRDAKLSQARDRYQHGFDYAGPAAARASGTASSSLPSGSSEMAPVNAPVDVPVGPLEQQVQRSEPQPIPQQQPAGHETLEQLNELMRFDGDVDDQGNGFGDNEDDEAQKDASIKSLTQSALGQAGQLPAHHDDDRSDDENDLYGQNAVNNFMFGNDDIDDDD